MSRRSPSYRWKREHGWKKSHRYWIQAAWHAWKMNTFKPDGRRNRKPYPCHWGKNYKDGETATMHWHIGRPTTNHLRGYDGPWLGHSPETQTGNKV